jgi:RimJ/RimL family protein N-acetyltransferase
LKLPVRFEFFNADDSGPIAAWVASRIPGAERGWSQCVAMRVSRDDTIGGVVFHDWNPAAGVMCMSAAGEPGWLNRAVLYEMHRYIFDTAGCQLAVMQVSELNTRMRRIGLAYGYTEHRVPRLRGRDEAEMIMTLPEENWRASRFHKGMTNGQI